MENTEKRLYYWDNIKGFLMLLVVFAHILLPFQHDEIINGIFDYIYIFHMPAFVFMSGYFGKSDKSSSFEAIIKLVFLYFVFNSIMWFGYGSGDILQPMYSYWYLIALIVWRLTARYLAKFTSITLILLSIAFLAGFFPSVNNTLAIARIISFYPFYMAGFLFSKERADKLIHTRLPRRLINGVLFFGGAVVIAVTLRTFLGITDNELQMFGYSDSMDAFARLMIFAAAALTIAAILRLAPRNKLPLLSMLGRNSLWIFVIHRPLTLLISDSLSNCSSTIVLIVASISTIAICVLLGNDIVSPYLNRFAQQGVEIFTSHKKGFTSAKLVSGILVVAYLISAVSSVYPKYIFYNDTENTPVNIPEDVIHRTMTEQQQSDFDNAFRLTFAGDLILLEDQVKRAYNGTDYDFADVFEYAEKYISSSDLAIGVFEGPMAGEEVGYSTSNFDDNKELTLNFPDSFAVSIKKAGFDLVTTANNHLLDKGINGAVRTLDILDEIGLEHIGSYRDDDEKEQSNVKLIECQGIKFAVLAYTYGTNGYSTEQLIDEEYSYLTSVIGGTSGEQFEALKDQVRYDFEKARALNPDLIIVLPHIGTQFSNSIDTEQETWFNIFKEFGADIILGDHPHAVEPVLITEHNGKAIYEAYCPGNFANIYRNNQGDTSILAEVYIDRATKKIIGGGIVPLYTQANADGNYRALPIYEIQNNKDLRKELSTDDLVRANTANEIITSVLFGHEMDMTSITQRYYIDNEGFIRSTNKTLKLTDEMQGGILFKSMSAAQSICFLGDSVTHGTKNGGCPWYEPILAHLDGKQIYNHSKGGCTVSYLIDTVGDIPTSDLYVIAIGTNDVRYRNTETCAMTAEEYCIKITNLKSLLLEKNHSAKFVFIAPWHSTDGDTVTSLSFSEKNSLNENYTNTLKQLCSENGDFFINANPYIREKLYYSPDDKYLLDHIHPNAGEGVKMYSEAVLLY